MEFFERAHVTKIKKSTKKDSKSEENVKKQLKQMLYGYKQSDNELIKSSVNIKNEYDDSSSVSGFSDLNITNSSLEADTMLDTVSSATNDVSLSDDNELDENKTLNTSKINVSVSSDSTSECNDDIQSLSEDLPSAIINNSDVSDDDSLANTNDSSTDYRSDDLESFDPDGSLAAKILQKLQTTEEKPKQGKKRKFEEKDTMEASITSSISDTGYKGPYKPADESSMEFKEENIDKLFKNEPKKVEGKNKPLKSQSTSNQREKDEIILSDKDSSQFFSMSMKEQTKINNKKSKPLKSQTTIISENDSKQCISMLKNEPKKVKEKRKPIKSKSTINEREKDETIFSEDDTSQCVSISSSENSSPFVSVNAANMTSQSFKDILGGYKYSTVKSLPSDTENIVFTDLGLDTFPIEDMSLADINVDDDVDSLIPEIDKDLTLEDIDLDTTALDASTCELDQSATFDDTLQSEQCTEREPSMESSDDARINRVKVYYGKNTCIFVLQHPGELYIHGKVKVKPLGGTIEIAGYILQKQPCEVYAPNHNYAQYIRTVENQNSYYGLFSKLTAAGLLVSEAEDIVTTLGDQDGVISLHRLTSKKMDFVENNFTLTDLFSKTSKNVDVCFKKASEMLGCSLYLTRPWNCLQENASWKQAIACGLVNQSRGIVCGGKGTGKSTFLRYYVNGLLGRGPALVLDLDPGQSEFTPAGSVSATVVTEPLLGPNFTHLRTPEIMLNVGMVNTMDHPRRYAEAVGKLRAHCAGSERLAALPWIVNTMGMCNTMGLKLISLIILQIKPTFLLQIDSKNPRKRFEFNLYPQTVKNLYLEDYQNDCLFDGVADVEDLRYTFLITHHSDSTRKQSNALAARDDRYLNYLAYFGQLLVHGDSLLAITPYVVNLKDVNICANVKIDQHAVTKVINGKVVALCQQATDNGLFTLADKPLLCHGHGLIRGIDWEKGVLFMITPTPAEKLAEVNTLVYADWAPELRGPERQLPRGTAVPYRTATQYHQRQLMFAPKRRFNPIQLLKMSRNT